MKRKLIGLLIVALLVVMAVPVFAADNTTQNEELKALYQQMYELQKQIAEKRGLEYDEDFFRQMYDYCNGMMGGYGMMGSGMMGSGMMGW